MNLKWLQFLVDAAKQLWGVVLAALRTLKPLELIGLVLCVGAIIYLVVTGRTDTQSNNKFIMDQLADYKMRLDKCETDRINDSNKFNARIDSITIKMFDIQVRQQTLMNKRR